MLKKAFIVLVLILSFCFSVKSLAQNIVTFSDNFDSLDYNGVRYTRFSSTQFYDGFYDILYAEVFLDDNQQDDIKSIELYTTKYENAVEANIIYKDGSVLSVKYLNELYAKEYEMMLNKKTGYSYVDFEWPDDNKVELDFSCIGSPDTKLEGSDLTYCDYFYVFTDNGDETITMLAGVLITVDGEYYYADFDDLNLTSIYSFDPSNYKKLETYKITDESLVEQIRHAEEEYVGDSLLFLTDEKLTDRLSKIFFAIILGIIPCIVAVIFLILCKRSSGIYKKLYGAITITALSTSVLFTILFALLMHYN